MFTAGAVIDLVAIAPFFLAFFWVTPVPWLWALRLLRMFKLGRYSTSVSTILTVVREERAVLSAAIMMLFLLTLFAATGIYVTEHAAQPDKFSSIPVSMYWAVITLTSIGYGDYYPITPIGKILTMVLAIAGLGMIALPAGILANGFSQKIKTIHEPRRRDPSRRFEREDDLLHAASYHAENVHNSDRSSSHALATTDEVLTSEVTRHKLSEIIGRLTRAEREALIAITVISLNENPATPEMTSKSTNFGET
jgi:voltage-gated potassium channel Kch